MTARGHEPDAAPPDPGPRAGPDARPDGRPDGHADAHLDPDALRQAGPGGGGPPLDPASPAPPPTMRAQATQGVVWAAAERWMVRTSTLVGFVLLSRLLEPREIGIVALAMVFINVLNVVADGGFTLYLLQRRSLTRAVTSTAFYISAVMGLVLGALLALGAPVLARVLGSPALGQVLPALAVALVVAALSNVPASLLQRAMRFRELARRQVVATVVSVVVAVVMALQGFGVWALVAQTLVRAGISLVMLWLATDFRPGLVLARDEARAMVSFGSKSMGAQLLRQVRLQGEQLLIPVLISEAALGFWAMALRLVDVVTDLCMSVFSRVAHPVFARLQDDSPRLGRALGTSLALSALVLVPLLVLLALTSEVVVPAIFGEQWGPAAVVAPILAVRSIAVALSDLQRSALLATGHAGTELAVTGVQIGIQLLLLVVFAPYGLGELAVALTVWAVLTWPLRTAVLRSLHGIGWGVYAQTGLVLVAAGLAGGAVVLATSLLGPEGLARVALAVAVGGLVYAGAVLALCRPLVGEALRSLPGPFGARARAARPGDRVKVGPYG